MLARDGVEAPRSAPAHRLRGPAARRRAAAGAAAAVAGRVAVGAIHETGSRAHSDAARAARARPATAVSVELTRGAGFAARAGPEVAALGRDIADARAAGER